MTTFTVPDPTPDDYATTKPLADLIARMTDLDVRDALKPTAKEFIAGLLEAYRLVTGTPDADAALNAALEEAAA